MAGATAGNTTDSDTATANQIAQQSTDKRTEWIKQSVINAAESDLRKVGWYYWNQPELVQDLSIKDRVSGVARRYRFYGGQFDQDSLAVLSGGRFAGQAGREWADYHLTINAGSLEHTDDPVIQKRAQDEFEMIMGQLVPLIGIQGINLARMIDRYGDAFNERDLSKIILNPNLLAQMGAIQSQMVPGTWPSLQNGQAGPQQNPGQPPMQQPPSPQDPGQQGRQTQNGSQMTRPGQMTGQAMAGVM
jgi:hypothetical protein